MSNASFDAMWHDAMGELHEQLYVEGIGDDDEMADGPKGVSILLVAFMMFLFLITCCFCFL